MAFVYFSNNGDGVDACLLLRYSILEAIFNSDTSFTDI